MFDVGGEGVYEKATPSPHRPALYFFSGGFFHICPDSYFQSKGL
jgi:hypothetical protein